MAEDIVGDLFHSCALLAYVEVASETRTDPPAREEVRRRAYRYYEAERRSINQAKGSDCETC